MTVGWSKSFLRIIVRWRWIGALLGVIETVSLFGDIGGGIRVLSFSCSLGVVHSFVVDMALT